MNSLFNSLFFYYYFKTAKEKVEKEFKTPKVRLKNLFK